MGTESQLRRIRWPSRAGLARRGRRFWNAVDDRLPHGRRVYPYRGFELVFSRGTSLVERIQKYGDYEPEIIGAIEAELLQSRDRTFVDVGASIGLISLAVVSSVPGSRVFAFEPARHQHELFAETIRRNGLQERIALSSLAMSDRSGTARFAVHSTRHAAGDGFLDTGRAGRARFVTVETGTLDRWWREQGRPAISVVKIDTEGSEFLVLRGAEELISRCRPALFLEIHEDNVLPYPYTPAEVRVHVEAFGYRLEAFGRADFVARPR